MLYGILNLSFWGYIVTFLLATHFTVIGVTVYLHRHQAHRALEIHPVICHLFRAYLWLTTGMSTRAWVAIHRKHHDTCETRDDPHSPQILGLKKVLLQGAELYRKESANQETIERYGKGAPNDWLENKLYSPHSALGIGIMLVIDLLLFGVPGITFWALQMMWIPFWAAGVVNGVGHYWGYRNFECSDASRNISPVGLIMGGEELHNNHHTFPNSAKLSIKRWEFDIGWAYIRLLSYLGLAQIKKVAPKPQLSAEKVDIDVDTLGAIITHRFYVLAGYCTQVILPVLKDERRKANSKARKLLEKSKTRNALISSEAIVDAHSKQYLDHILQNHEQLRLVYDYRLKLQELWNRTTATQKERLEALQEWCRQAETTGIEALHKFVRSLTTYTQPSTKTS